LYSERLLPVVKRKISAIFEESISLQRQFLTANLEIFEKAVHAMAGVLGRGNKIMFFGNGGSAADAQHLAAEFVNGYLIERPPLPALALTTDTSVLTAVSNDRSFEEVFEIQIMALGEDGDAAVGISTSGTSRNVVRALHAAKRMGLVTIGLGGPSSAPMREPCDYYFSVEGAPVPRIQEAHQLAGHAMIEVVDQILFGHRK
jgi:D-sedoheptulose 7-phosphate isomerase